MGHHRHEKAAFERSVDTTLENVEATYDAQVLLQSGEYTPVSGKRIINCFSAYSSRGLKPRPASTKHLTQTIDVSDGFISNGCYDNDFPSSRVILATFTDQSGRTLAMLDTSENLWFIDFYHPRGSGRTLNFPEFFDIISLAWGGTGLREEMIMKDLAKALDKIDAKRVKHIEITTEFDKEAYIASSQREFSSAVDRTTAILKAKSQSLQRTLDSERTTRDAYVKSEAAQAFTNGVSLLRDNPEWEVKENRLWYKSTIYVHNCMRGELTWDVPESKREEFYLKGLSLSIEAFPSSARATSAMHPNVSGSGSVCIGDLGSQSLSVILQKLPHMLETGGLNSPFNSGVSEKLILLTENDGYVLKGDAVKKHCVWETK